MDYLTMKRILDKERNSPQLSELPVNFYDDGSNYLEELRKQEMTMQNIRLYKNSYNCYTEIIERRIEKIKNKAYFKAISSCKINEKPSIDDEEIPSFLSNIEIEMYNNLLNDFVLFYEKIYEKNKERGKWK